MGDRLVKKGLSIGIIVLFVGTSIIPTIGCVYTSEKIFFINTINKSSISEDKFLSDYNTLYNLTVNVTTDKIIYKRFEPIEVTISVTNNGDEDWNYTFPDTKLADFDINSFYLWSRDKLFYFITIPITIHSGETVVLLRDYWYQFTNWYNNGWIVRIPVPPGNHTIRGWIAFSEFPTPPFGYSNITINKSLSKSVQKSSLNNNFNQYKDVIFKSFFEHYTHAYPILQRLL